MPPEKNAFLGIKDSLTQNFSSNKPLASRAGGIAEYLSSSARNNISFCRMCKSTLVLMIQLNAPTQYHHRRVYIFCCVTTKCFNNPNNFVVLSFESSDFLQPSILPLQDHSKPKKSSNLFSVGD